VRQHQELASRTTPHQPEAVAGWSGSGNWITRCGPKRARTARAGASRLLCLSPSSPHLRRGDRHGGPYAEGTSRFPASRLSTSLRWLYPEAPIDVGSPGRFRISTRRFTIAGTMAVPELEEDPTGTNPVSERLGGYDAITNRGCCDFGPDGHFPSPNQPPAFSH
jgi:hypothetical protein